MDQQPRSCTYNHNISDEKGHTLQRILCDDVETSWTEKDIYFYNIPGKLRVTIHPNPTRNQPGNGFVSFKDIKSGELKGKGFRWEELGDLVENDKFRNDYNTFMTQRLEAAYCEIGLKSFAANYLLLFEVARRIEDKKSGYPTQEQVKTAIRKVCSDDSKKYQEMVGRTDCWQKR